MASPEWKPENIRQDLHFLVIDDDRTQLELISFVFRKFYPNCQISTFTSPREGLEFYRREQENTDIILVDMSMPELDGLALAGQIRKIRRTEKIILMTGYPLEKIIKTEGIGNIDYILQKDSFMKADGFRDVISLLNFFIKKILESKKVEKKRREAQLKLRIKSRQLRGANQKLEAASAKVRKELLMARRVQMAITADAASLKLPEEIEVGTLYETMDSVGGDLLDVFPFGPHSVGFLLADVSGHGVPAALIASMAKVAFRNQALQESDPSRVCANVNEETMKLIGDLSHYLSAFYGVLDLTNGKFAFTTAGHPAALWWNKTRGDIQSLSTSSYLIGAFDEAVFRTTSVILNPGDTVLLYTDGITESVAPGDGGTFGLERLRAIFTKSIQESPAQICSNILDEVKAFTRDERPADDQALLCFRFHRESGG